MAKSKSQELISSMSAYDIKAFRNYLNSDYFNCDSTDKQLFDHFLTGIKREEAEKELVYSAIFQGKPYDDKQYRYIVSSLNKHLIHFFTLRQLEKEPIISESIACKALASRDCEKAFLMLQHENSAAATHQNADWYHLKFNNAETLLTYTGTKQNRKSTPDYSETLLNLDIFYLVKKLQLSCEAINLSNVLKKTYDIVLIDDLKKLAVKSPFNEVPAVQIYYHILEMLTQKLSEPHFKRVDELLHMHTGKFHPKELGEMYQYIKNFCVKQVNQGDINYLRTLFNIYRAMLENKTLMNYDYLSQWEFKNIVSISLRLNEKKWCEDFIQKYISFLKPEERVNALAYNLSYFLFICNDYRKAIRKLREVELNDVFYQLDARVILLKCYFELDETDSFFYQASAFRLFLLRNRHISDYQKNIYRNLIKFLTAIVRCRYSKTKLQKLQAEIEKEKNVADLNWLRLKVKEAM